VYVFDRINDILIAIANYFLDIENRIESSWIEFPQVKRFITRIRYNIGTLTQRINDLSREWDNIEYNVKTEILGAFTDIESWLNARQSKITSWFEVRFSDVEKGVGEAKGWIEDADSWAEGKVTEGLDNSKAKIEEMVSDAFESILNKVFE